MTVPQSLLVVALAVAWLIVLVPSASRRRSHVRQTVEGRGFRVLRRTGAVPGRRRRSAGATALHPRTSDSEGEMSDHDPDSGAQQEDGPHLRGDSGTAAGDLSSAPAPEAATDLDLDLDPESGSDSEVGSESGSDSEAGSESGSEADSDSERTVQLQVVRTASVGEFSDSDADDEHLTARGNADSAGSDSASADASSADAPSADAPSADASSADASDRDRGAEPAAHPAAATAQDDEEQLRAEYRAWRARTATAAPAAAPAVDPAAERPIPRRPGRGTFDPEAAERARAYKFARRRKVMLGLLLAIVASIVGAVLLATQFWYATGVLAALLALFMVYLRRQVKVEAEIRARRLAKLERARQIRPEYTGPARTGAPAYSARPPAAAGDARPYYRSNRTVVDLDDDDPSFDDLEQYEHIEYRRAVGQ